MTVTFHNISYQSKYFMSIVQSGPKSKPLQSITK